MSNPTRRAVLAGTTGLGAAALAGCVSGDSDDDGGNEPTENDTDEPTAGGNRTESDTDGGEKNSREEAGSPLELRDRRLRVESVEVGVEDSAEASVEGSTLIVDGVVPVTTPCHTAALGSVTFENGRLSIVLESERESADIERPCAGPVSHAVYELRLEFSRELERLETFESVTVEHSDTGGQRHVLVGDDPTEGAAEAEEPGDAVVDATITSTGSCSDKSERTAPAIDIDGQEVTVSGSFDTPSPCYDATLEEVLLDDGLSVTVGAKAQDVVCVQCLGSVSYEVTVMLAEGVDVQPGAVTVEEPSGGHRGGFENSNSTLR